MKKHANVAVFVPHAGCPRQCSFCDQRRILGEQEPPAPEQVREIIEQAAKTLPEALRPAQIAFFGGSFTAMDIEYIESLLQSVQSFIDGDNYYGIRISTRPDHISKDILLMLKKYHVTDIELGAQSMSDPVLQANLRGHRASDVSNASNHIKQMGFLLGLQMMTNLYMDNADRTVHTAQQIAELEPDYVRIYPAVVLRGTMLERLLVSGEYAPQTLDEAVRECSGLLEFFTDRGIPVIRMGLHDSPSLEKNIVAGPRHPAFRELCESRILMRKTLNRIERGRIPRGRLRLLVSPGSVSKMAGQKRTNLNELEKLNYHAKIIPDERVRYLQVEVLPEAE